MRFINTPGLVAYAQAASTGDKAPPEAGMAVAIFCEDGFPYSEIQQAQALSQAREAVEQSCADRGVSMPQGGWSYVALHPDEDWRGGLSPAVAERAEELLQDLPETTAVCVVFAYDPVFIAHM